MKQKCILHIIDSLHRGGAETLLVGVINHLSVHKNIIVLLRDINAFKQQTEGLKIYCLDHEKNIHLFRSVKRLKGILKKENADIVHSHLYWPTIIARLATNKEKLFSSYHSLLYHPDNKEQFSKKMLLLDRWTYKSKYHTIVISEVVKKVICGAVRITKNIHLLNNYVEDAFFHKPKGEPINTNLKVVAIGNLRKQKNHSYLIKSLANFNNEIALDIYGEGPEKEELLGLVKQHKLKHVRLMGTTSDLNKVLPSYDLFLLASSFEGFGIAMIEAMAAGLPCLVSDIPTFREVGKDGCLYFDINDKSSLSILLKEIVEQKKELYPIAEKGFQLAKKYSKDLYMRKLKGLYSLD